MEHKLFENSVARLLESEGYWVRRDVHVNVTPEEKRQIGKSSAPKPSIDMLAFHLGRNELLALEVKAYLDTPGAKLAQLQEEHEVPTGRFKLFTASKYREIVLARVKQDLIAAGMVNEQTSVQLGMIPGRVNQGQSEAIRAHMQERGWLFWSPEDVRTRVREKQA